MVNRLNFAVLNFYHWVRLSKNNLNGVELTYVTLADYMFK